MFRGRKQLLKFLSIVAVVALLAAGVVVTATAAPGPRDDVKTAQYGGGGGGGAGPTSGPCKGRTGVALTNCKSHAQKSLKKALAKCKKKHTAAARSKCKKAAHKKWDT